ncbi:hypothetical protein SERLA73DRAFT_104719 [Serpula lacrymans var. lacrymans S7.3]|uniref:Uncharacterized protein n=2 Tax=Serpula lacrymans var. lacrymans TaxID=341189 RepID=F8PQX3_SERL3|nr:uncharacterized protein SERLADRAFT_414216 [Serpula lacrymans var. lacrymans S7.9]EGO02317.1 hypothetical protein SERLA73DRAFT_104719 [Serpula lacrymans var. lacrymans S7.3]EGO28054.1 hypothetical protein SERLADRAFT_414216 [Serpula lacrymans var. lacrymans S7.9]
MSNYINPLHPPIPSAAHSSYTALANACPQTLPLQPPFGPILPTVRRLPQTPWTPHSKWNATMSRSKPSQPIMFDLFGARSMGLGVPMREMSTRSANAIEQMIVGARDNVAALMAGSGGTRKIRFRIMWPGYEHLDFNRTIELCTQNGPITRGQIVSQISSMFARFLERLPSEAPGPHGQEWRTGPPGRGISYDRLILVALWNVFEDTWMAEVLVDVR